MRIEELVIDGFKSYPVRTRITGWDSSFNAITGLNGSGKSNILDAICFVLGITNMSAMRAQNQTDLIYKRGTAGVTKASVTVVFNNSERDKSPVGYENLPQITVTRQVALPNVSKYLLNGHKATQNQIQNVFQSVQLNINNPNFVIMQGKITKVLNMKPPEILSLVEEAAGTRMFEDRKEKAKKAMDKKQRKVDELIATLEEEVTPKINKRRKQRDEFLEFQKAASELEKLGQMLTAYEWHQASGKVAAKESDIKAKKATIKEKQADIEKTRAEMKVIEKEIKEVEKRKEAEMKKGGKLAKLRAEQEKLAAAVKELKAQADLKAKDIKNEMGQVNGLESDVAEQQRLLDAKTQEIGKLTASSEQLQQIHATMDEKLQSNEALLQTLLTGVTDTKKNSSGGYIGALQSAQKREADGMAEEKQARNHLSMAENDLKDARKRLAAVQNQVSQNQTQLDVLRKEVQDLQSQLDKTEWTAEKESQLENIVRESRDTIRALSLKRQQLQVQLGRADFQYQPPQNFDTTKVKGTAARLMRLDPTNHDKATALEIAAGAKLFHVVVDDDDTGSRILKECQLKQRVTLIPLNKINARVINDNTLAKCRQFANGKQFAPATSLVQTDAKVQKALPYVFGETIICEDAQAANKITYGAQVRSVTVQGDVYDTGGTLSGGSAPSSSGTLVKIQGLINIDEQLNAAQTAADRAELELKKNERKRSQWRTLGQEMEMKAHELSVLEQQLDGSSASRVQKEVETHEGRIEQARMQLDTAQQKQKEAKVEIKKLEKDMEEFKDNKEGKIEELRVRINKERSQLQKHQVQVSTKKKEVQTASLEKEQIERELDDTSNNISKTKKNIKALEKDAKKLDEECVSETDRLAAVEATLKDEEAALSRFDGELNALQDTLDKKMDNIAGIEVEIQKLEHSLDIIVKEKAALEKRLRDLEGQYEWITEHSHEFGKRGGKYDFEGQDLNQMQEKVRQLEAQHAGKKKKINKRVVSELEHLEGQEKKLRTQLGQVLADKDKIESTVDELDGYKREALEGTWQKVSKDFGDIFNELLPGNFSKLETTEGNDLMAGLEVKVRLGSVWKQSLTELSGGQRSLIALSLIMALLQFKPAPMYILDEIDAALDLSHTQHIGQLFRTRFKGSQFIVVSLKEGLFTNANVLFRARFRDGTSVVERTERRSTSNVYA